MTTISNTVRAGRDWRRPSRAGRDWRRPSRALAALAAALVTISVTSGTALADPRSAPDPPSNISKDVRAKMDAQQPLTTAASLIQRSVERGNTAGYAGIGLGIGEVVVWWKGPLPPAAAQTIDEARRSAPVRVAPAVHTRAELEAAAKGIEHYLRTNPRSPYHGIDIAYDGSGLIVNTDPDRTIQRPHPRPPGRRADREPSR
jgi:hypothetical protein